MAQIIELGAAPDIDAMDADAPGFSSASTIVSTYFAGYIVSESMLI